MIWDNQQDPTIIPIKHFSPPKSKKPVAICGMCGNTDKEESGEGGLCKFCNGDYWVELEDFNNDQLRDYLETAANALKITVEELHQRIIQLNQGV